MASSLFLSLPNPLSSLSSLSPFPIRLSFPPPPPRPVPSLTILNGGGPRTFPGGVSKWEWKRMQSKKAKQMLKARLLRERQIYDIRKRSELKAAVAQLERPWEEVSPLAALDKAPTIFSVSADDQLRALADRFQRPGGFDMWSDRDGPQVLRSIASGQPPASRRFFPKGVAQSVKPCRGSGGGGGGEPEVFDDWIARGAGGGANRRQRRTRRPKSGSEEEGEEGVRPNAYEKGNGNRITLRPTADVVDVEAVGRREGVRSNYSERGNAKAAGSERYGLVGQRRRGSKNVSDSVTPLPASKSYNGRGGYREQIGDSKWDPGCSGSSTNHRRSR